MFDNIDNMFGFLEQQEGVFAGIVGGELRVFISYYSPESEEIEAFKTGPIQFGVGYGLGALVFACKINGFDWQDSLYSYHYSKLLDKQGQWQFVEPSVEYLKCGESLPLNIYLVDAETTELIAERRFTLPEELKSEVIEGLKEQKYSKIPIINTSDSSSKIQQFEFTRDFLECQPVEAVVKGLKKHTFNC